jgi:hypothetical protein
MKKGLITNELLMGGMIPMINPIICNNIAVKGINPYINMKLI